MTKSKSKAFFINGGAGRVISSIPALEKYALESGDKDFIIVAEGGGEFYKNHPILEDRVYEVNHKNLFKKHLIHKELITPEPYRVKEYFTQKCSIAQAFDIEINKKGIRELPIPKLYITQSETINAAETIAEIKKQLRVDKVAVFQPFGRGVHVDPEKKESHDPTGRSFFYNDVIKTMKFLQENGYAVIMFSEYELDTRGSGAKDHVKLQANLRDWAAIIDCADLFVGCDSVGQHISRATKTPTLSILGATYPINVSYPETDWFKVIDLGDGYRKYSPIRICFDEDVDKNNEKLMYMTDEIFDYIMGELKQVIEVANKKAGSSIPSAFFDARRFARSHEEALSSRNN